MSTANQNSQAAPDRPAAGHPSITEGHNSLGVQAYRRRTRELLADLAAVQARIRRLYPSSSGTDDPGMSPSRLAAAHTEPQILLHELRQRQTLLRRTSTWATRLSGPLRRIGPLVQRVWPALPVEVHDGGVWRRAQMDGIEIARDGQAYVRLWLQDTEALGPLTRVSLTELRSRS
jgi:hypothetical protein